MEQIQRAIAYINHQRRFTYIEGKIFSTCVQRVMVYGSETWAMKVEEMERLERTERMMVTWMCGVTLKDRNSSDELLSRLKIESVSDVLGIVD